jgi:peptidoglycan/xylan/chitin deacetylase (PgdA/CDA1 family)
MPARFLHRMAAAPLLGVMLCASSPFVFAQAAPGAVPAAVPEAEARRAEEAAAVRRHHLQRLDARLAIEPALLQQSCRYESDIATRPPARRVALTFDDGPEPGQTELILQTLDRYHVTAAFFMVGRKMQEHPELVAQVRAAGHLLVGNHSWDHPNFHDLSASEQADEVLRNEPLLPADAALRLFRYPYGNSSCETNELVHARGYRIVGWHVDSCDWAFDRNGTVDAREAASCNVFSQYHGDYVGHVASAVRARNGGIVLMHEIHPNTVRQLDAVIAQILAEGFTFGSLADEDFQASLR